MLLVAVPTDGMSERASSVHPTNGGGATTTDISGVLLVRADTEPKLVDVDEAAQELGLARHTLAFETEIDLERAMAAPQSTDSVSAPTTTAASTRNPTPTDSLDVLGRLHDMLVRTLHVDGTVIAFTEESLCVRSVQLVVGPTGLLSLTWEYRDDALASAITEHLQRPGSLPPLPAKKQPKASMRHDSVVPVAP